MGMQVGRAEAAGSFGRHPHGGRTSAMPTAEAGARRCLGPLSRRVGCWPSQRWRQQPLQGG